MAEQNRDLVLPLGTYAHILDRSKGHINVNVGPYKTTASETDVPVKWNNGIFERINSIDQAIMPFVTVEEGHYVVLQNPSADGKPPKEGTSSVAASLEVGRKVNTPGPVSFPLWPGQSAKVIEGHHLRSNQYLVVRVYNDVQARANWEKAVVKKQSGDQQEQVAPVPTLVMGQLLVIKGTDVAFYIPPTGVEVVADEQDKYVREAATLERLEYAILLDEDGNKRYISGPAVVFPKPTESFMVKNGTRKFRAIELSEISGIHVKVIAEYTEGTDKFKVGDELFITGKETSIYYPRPEHAIIKYDERELHYAVAIPEGDARYVLQRVGPKRGTVRIVRGPTMFLPDPREEVIVKRKLSEKEVSQLYPNNSEALQYNRSLSAQAEQSGDEYLATYNNDPTAYASLSLTSPLTGSVSKRFAGDSLSRKNTYTPPRSITLNNKYDGVINIKLWTGYAMLIVSSTGKRRVAVGPTHVQLEYDEFPQAFELSTGKPKNTDNLLTTVYLKVKHNQVSDIIGVTTKDMVDVNLKVSYRVDFQGDESETWFSVDNYVKFLCDHVRSLLKNKAKECGIAVFYNDAINIVRDTVLGKSAEGGRPGLVFEENSMVVYDVEVLDVSIANKSIAGLLEQAQHTAVADTIDVGNRERGLEVIKKQERITQESLAARAATEETQHRLKVDSIARRAKEELLNIGNEFEADMARVNNEIKENLARQDANKALQAGLDEISAAKLKRESAEDAVELDKLLKKSNIEVQAVVERMKATPPELVAALTTFGQQDVVTKMLDALAPVAMAQNLPALEYAKKVFEGTPFSPVLDSLSRTGISKR